MNYRRKRFNPYNFLPFIIVGLILVVCSVFGQADEVSSVPGKMIEETYIVRHNDTLIGIAQVFMKKNTYGPRGEDEFKEGIYELNYESVFMQRENEDRAWPKMIFPGDELKIRYWVKEE